MDNAKKQRKTIEWERKLETKETFHARMGMIKDRKTKDVTETEEIRKGGQNTQKKYIRKILMTQITLMVQTLTQSQTFWNVKSNEPQDCITMNKASGGDGISVELFQILKDDAVKALHSICQQFGKLSSGHRTGKGQFSFRSQRRQCQSMLKLLHNCTHLTHQ